jgi:HJR/Mrr/RecB family endonuclease
LIIFGPSASAAAYVVTNSTFTPQARRTARQLGVILANHGEVARILN